MTSALRATIVIPTHDHGPLLAYAARTALSQTVQDIELFIIGDGVPDVTRDIVAGLQRTDSRVRFFDYPKGPRLGEAYRHEVLAHAGAPIVCYLSDDDLWLSNHVATMEALLAEADFANALSLRIEPDGSLLPGNTMDFRIPRIREFAASTDLALGGTPLSCMAHTMAIYRKLPRGWHTTPKGIPTNVHMTRQFVALEGCRLINATQPTLLRFMSALRRQWTMEQRLAELEEWAPRVTDPAWLGALPSQVLDGLIRVSAERWIDVRRLEVKVERMRALLHESDTRFERERGRVQHLRAQLAEMRERLRTARERTSGGVEARDALAASCAAAAGLARQAGAYVSRLARVVTRRTSGESGPPTR